MKWDKNTLHPGNLWLRTQISKKNKEDIKELAKFLKVPIQVVLDGAIQRYVAEFWEDFNKTEADLPSATKPKTKGDMRK